MLQCEKHHMWILLITSWLPRLKENEGTEQTQNEKTKIDYETIRSYKLKEEETAKRLKNWLKENSRKENRNRRHV